MKRIISLLSALALVAAMTVAPAAALAVETLPEDGVPVTGDLLPNGDYAIQAITDSGMINIASCNLLVEDGLMTAHLVVTDNTFQYLFVGGTAEDAQAADSSRYAPSQVGPQGSTLFEAECPALNVALPCALYSESSQTWYNCQIMFLADDIDSSVLPTALYLKENNNPLTSAAAIDLEAGTYQMDVTMEGGTGKASIASPCTITVTGGKAMATIEWSSEFYDYMVVDGYIYYPTNTTGNSVFEIPVLAYDAPFDVVGDTIAMTTPHEIDYTLTFHSETAKAVNAGAAAGFVLPTIIGVVAVIIILIVVLLVRSRRKNAAPKDAQ